MSEKNIFKRILRTGAACLAGAACILGCAQADIVQAGLATIGDATHTDICKDVDVREETDVNEDVNTPTDSQEDEQAVAADNEVESVPEEKKYEGSYRLAYILSHYSYFVKEDLTGDCTADTVGTVMVGGRLELDNTVGKVKAAAGYARTLVHLADYPIWSWNDTDGIDTNFYYTENLMTGKEWLVARMVHVDGDFIDMEDAFAAVREESQELADSGAEVCRTDETLTLDFAHACAWTMAAEDFAAADKIVLTHVSVGDLFTGNYAISVTGNGNYALDFGKIEIDGKPLACALMPYVQSYKSCIQGGQYYDGGLGLVWNFPDAESVTVCFLAGHLVAPCANVCLTGGNHEGQVVAKRVESYSESHFYPYSETTATTATTDTAATTTATDTTTTTTTTDTTVTTQTTTETTATTATTQTTTGTTTTTATTATADTTQTTTEKSTATTTATTATTAATITDTTATTHTTTGTTTTTATTETVDTAQTTTEKSTDITTVATSVPTSGNTARPASVTNPDRHASAIATGDSKAPVICAAILIVAALCLTGMALVRFHMNKKK